MLFRTELGAGLIKIRHDECWRKLTCLYYHYETQPLPNPLSWYFHQLPKRVHRAGVLFSHLVQIGAPFGLFFPQPVAALAGALIIVHQLLLIVSGNYAWLNWLTVVLGVTAFSDAQLTAVLPLSTPVSEPRALPYEIVLYGLGIATLLLSVRPIRNFFSPHQLMNHNFNPLGIVNAYGAFGSVTRERYEVVVEGAADEAATQWEEYGFKAKPGDPRRRPAQVAPYHLRLDWLMWFLPLGGDRDLWFRRFLEKLLRGDKQALGLLRSNPFPDRPPRWIRARLFRYRYTTWRERKDTGAWWVRELAGTYTSPLTLGGFRAPLSASIRRFHEADRGALAKSRCQRSPFTRGRKRGVPRTSRPVPLRGGSDRSRGLGHARRRPNRARCRARRSARGTCFACSRARVPGK
jgi:hypothetical protein